MIYSNRLVVNGLVFIVFNFYLFTDALAQDAVKNIIPLSPNAASIAQYGETPVNKFTGVPSISVPLFEIATPNFSIPIGLSYNASGNKVEGMASSVGLGWSLNTIPVISRSVNGIPDNSAGGYFTKYQGNSVYDFYFGLNGVTANQYDAFLTYVKMGEVDSEPDVFSISILGFSGKFVYDQVNEKFITYPSSNIKIEFSNNAFYVTDDKGINYYFDVTEKTTTNTAVPGETVITSWYPSELYKFDNSNKVTFQYRGESLLTKNKLYYSHYQLVQGSGSGGGPSDEGSYQSISTINSKVISQINFPGGYAKFIPSEIARNDISGAYAINKIELYNNSNRKIKSFDLHYSYFTGSGCLIDAPFSKYWLKLDSLSDNLEPDWEYSFEYKSSGIPPCRNSPAQDYWGYYNGENSNQTLIPTQTIVNTDPPIQYQAADRSIDESSTQFGIIQRVNYPTGGHTDFVFENHTIDEEGLPGQYTEMIAEIEESAPPMEDYIEEFFTISNPPDEYLNDDNPDGGSYVSVTVGNMSCEGSPECGLLYLKGLSPSNNFINITFTGSFNYFLPNGDYKMYVQFNQDPPQTNGFFYQIIWNKLEQGQILGNPLVGGLRVKTIKTYEKDGATPLTREYIYKEFEADSISSGIRLNQSKLEYSDLFIYRYYDPLETVPGATYISTSLYQKFKAYSNTPQVTSSSGLVGYRFVIEKIIGNNTYENIKTEFDITPTVPVNTFPFPPTDFESDFNGKTTYEEVNATGEYSSVPLKVSTYDYSLGLNQCSITYGLKIGDKILTNRPDLLPTPNVTYFYEFTSNVALLQSSSQIEGTANSSDYFEKAVVYSYDEFNNQNESDQENSNGDIIKTISYYPYDLSYSSDEEAARLLMIANNEIGVPVKSQVTNGSTLVSEAETFYNEFFTGVYLPSKTVIKKSASDPGRESNFAAYNLNENLVDFDQDGSQDMSFIWSEEGNLVLAKIQGEGTGYFTSFETADKGGWTYTGSLNTSTYKTGMKAYNLGSGSVTKTGIGASASTPYKVGFWARRTSGAGNVNVGGQTEALTTSWKWVEKTITSPSLTISGSSVVIDELRLHPADAMMTSYTYEPLVGMTSQTDPRGYTLIYEYDTANRLKTIKDEDGNILEHYEYNYASGN